uniref:Uncharacterized protein n=1 Tax=Kalanchoe fedtschenkoi TaxID=63787 RepID=A0A7N0UR50_KALFE
MPQSPVTEVEFLYILCEACACHYIKNCSSGTIRIMLDLTNLHYLFHLCIEPCLIGMVIKPVLMEKFHKYVSQKIYF